MGEMSGMLFLVAVMLISMLLFGLIVGSLCLAFAQNPPVAGSAYVKSTTTYWIYMSVAFAIGLLMLLVLLYLCYAWSCACAKPMCPPKRERRSACAPSACY